MNDMRSNNHFKKFLRVGKNNKGEEEEKNGEEKTAAIKSLKKNLRRSENPYNYLCFNSYTSVFSL